MMGINSQQQLQQQTSINGPGAVNYQISSGTYHPVNGGSGLIGTNLPHSQQQQQQSVNSLNLNPSSLQSLCCLVENGSKCMRAAGNASYSKRIEKQVAQRKLQLVVDSRTSHTYICEHHKQIIQSIRASGKRKRKDDDLAGLDDDISMNDGFNGINDCSNNDVLLTSTHHPIASSNPNMSLKTYNSSNNNISSSSGQINLHSLQVNTLRRYKRHFKIPTRPGINKNQLADEMSKHFRTIPVHEKDVISTFMYMIKYSGNKLDVGSGTGSSAKQNNNNND